MEETRFVRRAPSSPTVWLGERERAGLVAPSVGARFPAYPVKEADFVLDLDSVREAARRKP